MLSIPRKFVRTALLLPVLGVTLFLAGVLRETSSNGFTYRDIVMTTTVFVPDATRDLLRGARKSSANLDKPHVPALHLPGAVKESEAPLPLQPHHYRDDGLMAVNPEGNHPVFELIERAEAAWEDKLARASRSLDEAVSEYERRYHRKPPLGFDHWWDFVQKHNVQLPDEYDQIYEDLEPFWGIDPADFRKIEEEWEGHLETYTIGKMSMEDPITIVNVTFHEENRGSMRLLNGALETIDLLKEVHQYIPPFRAIYSPHDNPDLLRDYDTIQWALDAAASGTYVDMSNPPPIIPRGWIGACAPDSPARLSSLDLKSPPTPSADKTFIHNHKLTMDPCMHPSHLQLHGQFLSHSSGPSSERKLYPQFSMCTTMLHNDLMHATPSAFVDDLPLEDNPDWAARTDERLLWRGSNTGIWHASDTLWPAQQRVRLVEETNRLKGNVSVLRAVESPLERVGPPQQRRRARLNPAMMDVAFAGGQPINCASDTCTVLSDAYEFRAHQPQKKAGNYKYVMDVDGNGWSSRYKRLITSNSLVFKSSVYPEWFTDRVQPWVHYVPVQIDYSDLYDSLMFFRGDLDGKGGHDEMAQKIAEAGRAWSKSFWRREDLSAYLFRLMLEYSRVLSSDRDAQTYKGPSSTSSQSREEPQEARR